MKRIHVYVSGRVQGVFFRAETERAAKALNLSGWVRNLDDGRVEALFEGDNASADQMLSWCHSGPPHARVESVESAEEPFTGNLTGFTIRYR